MLDTGKGNLAMMTAILLVTAGLAGCATPEDEGETIKIGTLLPITGNLATFGPDMQRAVELAVEEINDAGGIDGRNIEVVNEDSRTDPAQAPQAMQRLINEGVVAVVGAASSGVTSSVRQAAVDNKVVLITPASTGPALTEEDNDGFFFRVPPNDVMQGQVLAQVLAEDNITRVATLFVNNDYGQGLNDALKDTFLTEYQGAVQNEVEFDDKSTTFDSEVRDANTGSPDAIVYIGYPGTGVPIMQAAQNQGVVEETPFYFSEGVFSESFVSDVGQNDEGEFILAGFKGSTPEALTGATTAASFAERFNDGFGHDPELFAAQSFDATMAIALGIAAANSDDPADFKSFMRDAWNSPGQKVSSEDLAGAIEKAADGQDVDYRGVSTDFDWNNDNDPVRGLYAVWQVQDDGSIELTQRDIEKSL